MHRVLVIGSSNWDQTLVVERLPSSGMTCLGHEYFCAAGGKGANLAVAAQRAGARVTFVTAVGDDALGREVMERLHDEGLDTSHARTISGAATGTALIFVAKDGTNLIGVAPNANHALTANDIEALDSAAFDAHVAAASLEIPVATALAGLRRARAAGLTTILNPAPVSESTVSLILEAAGGVDIITPNQSEAETLTGISVDTPTDAHEAARRLRERGFRSVVLTLGEYGAWVSAEGIEAHCEAPRVKVKDTVGAGDAFNGALAAALARGSSLVEAVRWAVCAGALAVTKPGAQGGLATREEIDRLVACSAPAPR